MLPSLAGGGVARALSRPSSFHCNQLASRVQKAGICGIMDRPAITFVVTALLELRKESGPHDLISKSQWPLVAQAWVQQATLPVALFALRKTHHFHTSRAASAMWADGEYAFVCTGTRS